MNIRAFMGLYWPDSNKRL